MEDLRGVLRARSYLRDLIREFFSERGYLAVDTPVVVPCPGVERELRYFPTSWLSDSHRCHDLWLRSSPELHMKQLCAQGLESIYQLGPCFRSGGEYSQWHHPEFWMLEWYTSNQSFASLKAQTEDFLRHCFDSDFFPSSLPSCTHLTVAECFERWLGVFLEDQDPELPHKLKDAGVHSITPEDDFESAYHKAMLEVMEPCFAELGMVMLCEYPPSQRILSALGADGHALRVEVYIKGVEVSHGCVERVGREEHRVVFSSVHHERSVLGYEVPSVDEYFLEAAEALPQSLCGSACGFDRLLALLLDRTSLATVMPFSQQIYPTLE